MSTRHLLARQHKNAKRTAGNLAFNSTTWTDADNALDRVLAAAAGDVLEAQVNCLWNSEAVAGRLDVATVVSAARVNYMSGGTGLTSDLGIPGWMGPASVMMPIGACWHYVVQTSDLASGYVTARLVARCDSPVTKNIYATTAQPLQFAVKNIGPPDPN